MAKNKETIKSEVTIIEQELTQKKQVHINNLEKGINEKWGGYLTAKEELSAKKTALKIAANEQAQIEKRKIAKEHLNEMEQKLKLAKEFVGGLSDDFAKKLNLNIQRRDSINFDVFFPNEIAYINNQRYRTGDFGGASYLQVTNDEGLTEDLVELKELLETTFPAKKLLYEKAFKVYEDKHGKDSLRNWKGVLGERKPVDDAGMSANKTCEKMYWMARAIEDYWKKESKTPTSGETKLVGDAKAARGIFGDAYMIDLGIKKPTPKLYRPIQKTAKDVNKALKNDPNLALEGLLNQSANTLGAQYTKIKDLNAEYVKKLSEIEKMESDENAPVSKLIEEARDLVFKMRALIDEWLDNHKNDTGEKQVKQRAELAELDKHLQKHISLIANIALTQDNYLEIQDNYDGIARLIPAWQDLHGAWDEAYKEYELVKDKGTNEEIQAKIDACNLAKAAFDKYSNEQIKPKLTSYIKEATAWKKKHEGMKGFAIQKKQNAIFDQLRECYNWGDYIEGFQKDESIFKTQEPYNKDKDSVLKEVLSKKKEVMDLLDSTDYKKRFRLLGDLNEKIQKWEFAHRNYNSKELGESQKTIIELKDVFVINQHAAVTAHMSIDGLEKGMNDNLEGYCKLVEKHNTKKLEKEQMPELLKGSTALLEFLNLWEDQHKKLIDSGVYVPEKRLKTIEALKTRHDKLRKTLEDNNLIILTGGMVDPDLDEKIAKNRESISINQTALEDAEKEKESAFQKISALTTELRKLNIDLSTLDNLLSKEKDATKKLEIQKRIEKWKADIKKVEDELSLLNENWQTLMDSIKELTKSIDGGTELQAQMEKRQSLKGGATEIYQQILTAFEEKELFQYQDGLDESEQANRTDYINAILTNIGKWEKDVLNPDLPQLAVFKSTLDKIQADLEFHNKQFDAGKAYVDKTYALVLQTYQKIAAIKSDNVEYSSKKTFELFLYCQKLIAYWSKENPIEIVSNADKFKEVQVKISPYITDQIKGDRFIGLKLAKDAQDKLDAFKSYVDDTQSDLDKRLREFNADKIYYGNDDTAKKAIQDSLKLCSDNFNNLFVKTNKFLTAAANKIAGSTPDYNEIIKEIIAAENTFTEAYKGLQFSIHQVMVKEEQLVFAIVGENDFDLYAGGFSEDQIVAMTRSLANITERARAVLKGGGTVQEAELMFEHIPVALWPDEFVSELQAFKKVEQAFEEEQMELARKENEDEKRALGLTDFVLDIGSAEGAKNVADTLSSTRELANFKEWNPKGGDDGKGGYDDKELDGSEQSKSHKIVANSLDWANYGMELFSTIKTFKNLPPEQQAKAAQEYLFTGQVNFETGEALTDPAAAHLSERKRVILLTGMRFVAKTASIIDKTADTYKGAPELLASCRGIMLFFNGLASAIEMYDDSKKVAKSSQEHWDRNMDNTVNIVKGLLGVGSTIADTFRLFQQIPLEVVPALGLASSAVNFAVDVYGIAKKVNLRNKTEDLKEIAKLEDRDYVGPLQQEISSLNRKIAKQSVDVVADVTAMAGSITTLAGVAAPVGAAITLVAGIIKMGNELVFFGINEKLMADCREMLEKARKGDRNAMMDIMSQSPMYAKMFIAIGATKEPADPIALEFLRQRGITEKDLKDEGTSKWIVRRFVRTQLLEKSDEKDSHDSYFKSVENWKTSFDKWRAESNKKTGFWAAGSSDYQGLMRIYSTNQLKNLLADFESKKTSWFSSTRQEVQTNAMLIKNAFTEQKQYLDDALENTAIDLEDFVEKDKKEVGNTYELDVRRLEDQKEGLTAQLNYITEILTIVARIFN